jgi:hypothetical protein
MADVPIGNTTTAKRPPGTMTIRVSVVLWAAAVAAVAGALWWAGSWLTGLTPLQVGAGATGVHGLTVVRHTQDANDTGPPVYRWSPHASYTATLWLQNTASVPITITGADHTSPDWVGAFTGPTLALARLHGQIIESAFRPLTIPAGGERMLSLSFHSNPKACQGGGIGGIYSTGSVTFRFTVLGVVQDSQSISLDSAFYMEAPTRADCRRSA